MLTKFALSSKATADKNHNQFTENNILLVLAYVVMLLLLSAFISEILSQQ